MKIALFETITPGNVGAVARVMKNFGFNELLLIKPGCDHLSEDSFQRACHAGSVLENVRVITQEELFDGFVVGTTSKAFTRRAHRQAVTPDKLDFVPNDAVLLFGPEDNGLPNSVLEKCKALISIPTGTEYQSLNLSHAVAIVLYELSGKLPGKKLINLKLKSKLLELFNDLSGLAGRDESLKGFLKNVFNRSVVYEKEGHALIGLLQELKKRIKDSDLDCC